VYTCCDAATGNPGSYERLASITSLCLASNTANPCACAEWYAPYSREASNCDFPMNATFKAAVQPCFAQCDEAARSTASTTLENCLRHKPVCECGLAFTQLQSRMRECSGTGDFVPPTNMAVMEQVLQLCVDSSNGGTGVYNCSIDAVNSLGLDVAECVMHESLCNCKPQGDVYSNLVRKCDVAGVTAAYSFHGCQSADSGHTTRACTL